MVLIISNNDDFYTTNDVINWLNYYKIPFYRLSYEDLTSNAFSFNISENSIAIYDKNNKQIQDIHSIWFRRTFSLNVNEFLKSKEYEGIKTFY